ncbi:hypothetical protein [Tomitella gaofuii]|uniref:hypothetical protein n=1 Tax=Tomitella gaofuii TaxID=2760083 RepID=UPI0015FD87E1|nr:hypothetical protein [Tomitella gaofuii]
MPTITAPGHHVEGITYTSCRDGLLYNADGSINRSPALIAQGWGDQINAVARVLDPAPDVRPATQELVRRLASAVWDVPIESVMIEP